jgi:membrane protease YdiL (CAAX protease family)
MVMTALAEGTRAPGTSPPPPAAGALRGLIARRPMTAFLVLTFLLAYPLMALPILAARGVIPDGWMRIAPDEMAGALLTLGALVPATLIVTWCTAGRAGLAQLVTRMFRWRFGAGWVLVVLAGLPALTVGLALLLGDSLRPVDPAEMVLRQLGLLAVNFLLVNLWEETAWAGFLQTRLEHRHNLFVAALITAVPFAFAHLPLALFDGVTTGSLAGSLLLYLILGLLVRPMLGVVLRGARDSVFAVALLHSVFNRTNNDNGIAAQLLDGETRTLTMLIAVVLLTAVTAVTIRRRLTRRTGSHTDRRGHRPVMPTGEEQPSAEQLAAIDGSVGVRREAAPVA